MGAVGVNPFKKKNHQNVWNTYIIIQKCRYIIAFLAQLPMKVIMLEPILSKECFSSSTVRPFTIRPGQPATASCVNKLNNIYNT